MEFLTLHELSRELNKPERQLRHKFKNLLKKNTMIEGEDFIRDGYIDEQHFIFKINPVRFVALTQLNPAPLPEQIGYQVSTNLDNNGYQIDSKPVTNVDNKPQETVTIGGNQPEGKAAVETPTSMNTSVMNDFIELMKEQLREKDKQLKEKDEQLKSKDDLLKEAQAQSKDKDNAQILALTEIIRLNKKLLPPAPGESVIDVDMSGYQPGTSMDTNGGNRASDLDNNFGNTGYQGDTNDRV
jgi:hypothetical protein